MFHSMSIPDDQRDLGLFCNTLTSAMMDYTAGESVWEIFLFREKFVWHGLLRGLPWQFTSTLNSYGYAVHRI